MKDMGSLHYCLGITVEQSDSQQCLWLHQKQYIFNILVKYKMTEAKIATTPIDPNVRLQKDDKYSKRVNTVLYQSIVGSLLYAAIATRPDIAHAVGVVSKFSSSPTEAHLTAAKRTTNKIGKKRSGHARLVPPTIGPPGPSAAAIDGPPDHAWLPHLVQGTIYGT